MAVVGNATVVVRALVEKFNEDLRAGFNRAERDADVSGRASGDSFVSRMSERTARLDRTFADRFKSAAGLAEGAGNDSGGSFLSGLNSRLRQLDTDVAARLRGLDNKVFGPAGASGGQSLVSRFNAATMGLDRSVGEKLRGLDNRVFGPAGDSGGKSLLSRFNAATMNLDSLMAAKLRGLDARVFGPAGQSSGESFMSGISGRLRGLDDSAFAWLGRIRGRFGDEGDAAGSTLTTRLRGALRRGSAGVENEASQTGSRFATALERKVGGMKIRMPDLGGAISGKLLALLPVVGVLGGAIASLGAGFIGLAGSIGQAAGVMGALPGLMAGVIGTALAGVVAFGGIGAAVKALGTQQAQAGRSALTQGRQARASANAVASANRQVVAANQAVIDSERALQRAREDVARTRQDDARATADAARQVQDAEESLRRAQLNVIKTQEDLTRAREDAREKLEELQFQARGAALDEEAAALRLRDAQDEYNKAMTSPAADDRKREDASLALRQAQLAYDEAKDRNEDTQKENDAAQKAGVEGSQNVIDAQAAIVQAEKDAKDAAVQLTRARQDQARTAQDVARAEVDAAQRVVDAQRAVVKAQQDVVDAHRAVADAQAQSAESAQSLSSANTAMQKAFAHLSPEAAHFARYLSGLRPEIDKLRAAAGQELFPKLEKSISSMVTGFFPTLRTALKQAGSSLGDFSTTMAKTFTAPDFKAKFSGFFDQFYNGVRTANGSIAKGASPAQDMYDTVSHLATAFIGLANAALPLIDRFTSWVSTLTGGWAKKLSGDTTSVTNTLNKAGDAAALIGKIFGSVGGALKNTFGAAIPLGEKLLKSLSGQADKWKEWSGNSKTGGKTLKDYFGNPQLQKNIAAIGHFIVELIKHFAKLGASKGVGDTFDALTAALDPLTGVLENATDLGPGLVKMLTEALKAVKAITDSKAFPIFIGILTETFKIITAIMNSPFGLLIAGLLGVMAVVKAISLVTKFTGLQNLAKLFAKGIFLKGDNAQGLKGFANAMRGFKTDSDKFSDTLGNELGKKLGTFRDRTDEAKDAVGRLETRVNSLRDLLRTLKPEHVDLFSNLDADQLNFAKNRLTDLRTEIGDMQRDAKKGIPIDTQRLKDAYQEAGDLAHELRTVADQKVELKVNTDNLTDDGKRAMDQYANGMQANMDAVKRSADRAGQTVADYLEQHSPARAGALSKNGGTGGWGEDAGRLFAGGLDDSVAHVRNAAGDVATAASHALSDVKPRIDMTEINREFDRITKDVHLDQQVIIDEHVKYNSDHSPTGTPISYKPKPTVKETVTAEANKHAGGAAGGAVANALQDAVSSGFDPKSIGMALAFSLMDSMADKIGDLAGNVMGKMKDKFSGAAEDAVVDKGAEIGKGVADKAGDAVSKRGGKIASAMGGIGGKVAKAGRGIGMAMNFALGPVGLIIIGIALLAAGLIYAYKHSEKFRKIVKEALEAAKKAFDFLWDGAKKVFNWLKDNWPLVLAILTGPIGLAVLAITKHWDDIKAGAKAVKDWIVTKFNELIGFVTGLPGRVAAVAASLWTSVTTKFGEMRTNLNTRITDMVNYVTGLPGRIGKAVAGLWTSFQTKFGEMRANVNQRITDLVTYVTGIPGRIGRAAAGLWNSFTDKFASMRTSIGEHITSFVSLVSGLPGRIGRAVSGMWDGLWTGFRGAINWIIDRWNNLHLTLGGQRVDLPFGQGFTIPSVTLNTPNIPRLAQGATVLPRNGGTLALLAEAGRSETVVDTGKMNALIAQVNAQLARSDVRHGGGTQVILSEGAVNMTVNNPVGQTTEQTLNMRMRSLASLGVIDRLVPAVAQ